ncbi:MAG: InlB B-repeat-containing protein, partial [Thermoplasmata archaeon]
LSLVVTGLPPGTVWSVNVAGSNWTTNQSAIQISAPGGSVGYAVESPIPVGPGLQYLAEPSSGTVNLTGGTAGVTVVFVPEALILETEAGFGTVSMTPVASGWYEFGAHVALQATPGPAFAFRSWNGSGSGSYNGSANPAMLNVSGPILETAEFVALSSSPSPGTGTPGGSGSVWMTPVIATMLLASVVGFVVAMNVAVRFGVRAGRRR